MKKVRLGVLGLGNMGSAHARNIAKDNSRDFCLAAVCDSKAERADRLGAELDVPRFRDHRDMYASGLIDAVIVATPHYWHPAQTIRAARSGLHVLCEKPLASTVGPARAMIAECRKRRRALGVVLHHRSRAIMIKARQLIDRGAIGEVFRIQLICSSWFRTQAYYDSGAWRGTWDGEGGGVLINQAPHHLDLFYWLGGMPGRITGFLSTRAHNIEVEDTANFLCEYEGGKIGYIYATTAEEPGMEQLMVVGDRGTIVIEGGKLRLGKVKIPIRRHIMSSRRAGAGGAEQEIAWRDVPLPKDPGGRHILLVRAFAAHILRRKPMYVDGSEAVNELELSNAMYIAGFRNRIVDLPVDAAEMERLITSLERERSTGKGCGTRAAAQRDLKKLLRGN
jgi:predicted dehydrogenase